MWFRRRLLICGKSEEFTRIWYILKPIFINRCIIMLFFLRKHKVNEEVDPGLEDDTESALNAIIEEEVHREIIAAIEKLPPERRKNSGIKYDGIFSGRDC